MKPDEPSNGRSEAGPQEPSATDTGTDGRGQRPEPAGDKTPTVSARKREANQRNALKSMGPRSPAGKRRASRNAIKHGFFSKYLLVDGDESQAELAQLRAALYQHYQPFGFREELCIDTIAMLFWRYRRVIRFETGLIALALAEHGRDLQGGDLKELGFDDSSPEIDTLRDHLFLPSAEHTNIILRYQKAFTKELRREEAELERLQSQRKARDLQNEAKKPFEINATSNVVAFKKADPAGGDGN